VNFRILPIDEKKNFTAEGAEIAEKNILPQIKSDAHGGKKFYLCESDFYLWQTFFSALSAISSEAGGKMNSDHAH